MYKRFLISTFILVVTVLALSILTVGTPPSAYATSQYQANFYVDRGQSVYYSINQQTGFTFPEMDVIKEGYEFVGWTEENNELGAIYASGSVYQDTLKKNTNFYAVWTEIYPEQNSGGIYLTTGEKIGLMVGVGIMLVLIAFAYQFFVVKKKNVKDLMFWKKNKD